MLQKCDRIGIPCLGSVIYDIEGREARMCYDALKCKLQLIRYGKVILDILFPLMMWDEIRELGADWVISGVKPTDKHAA